MNIDSPIAIMPAWLRYVAHANPLSYEVHGMRDLLLGISAGGALWLDFTVGVTFLNVTAIIAAKTYPRVLAIGESCGLTRFRKGSAVAAGGVPKEVSGRALLDRGPSGPERVFGTGQRLNALFAQRFGRFGPARCGYLEERPVVVAAVTRDRHVEASCTTGRTHGDGTRVPFRAQRSDRLQHELDEPDAEAIAAVHIPTSLGR